jgi:hypothetical protein
MRRVRLTPVGLYSLRSPSPLGIPRESDMPGLGHSVTITSREPSRTLRRQSVARPANGALCWRSPVDRASSLSCQELRTLTATGRRVARVSGVRTRYRGNKCFTSPKPASAKLPHTAMLK